MSYILNRTDGTILTELVDGVLDRDTTDIALVGRNYTGYGEFINENFIKMLENFANTNVPVNPLRGQLWYDTSIGKLKVYDGLEFVPAAGSVASSEQPQEPVAGDTWFNTDDDQLYLFDGSEFQLIGPPYTAQQGRSGVLVSTIQDRNLNSRTVLRLVIGDVLQAIISREEFIPNNVTGNIIPQLVTPDNPQGTIRPGFNIINPNDFVFRGSALRTQRVVTATGDEILASQILRNDQDGILLGSLGIRSSAGLILGPSQNTRFIVSDGLTIQNTQIDDNMHFIVNSSTSPLSAIDAITVKTQPQHVGIFESQPQYTLDVGGDMRVAGDLIVNGSTTTINSTTLTVDDKNIELAVVDTPTDQIADGGGITLKGDSDKTLQWELTTESWTSSEHVDLVSSKEYRINAQKVLDFERLGSGIRFAYGLEEIGTLNFIDIDNVNINDSEISTSAASTQLSLVSGTGDITVNNSVISMLNDPVEPHHAATKFYVDQQLQIDPLVFSLDTTGWVAANTVDANIINYLDAVFPPTTAIIGKQARIITTFFEQQTVTGINVALEPIGPTSIEHEDVQAATGGIVSVVEDIALPSNATGTYTPAAQRQVRVYEIVSPGQWAFQNTISVTEV